MHPNESGSAGLSFAAPRLNATTSSRCSVVCDGPRQTQSPGTGVEAQAMGVRTHHRSFLGLGIVAAVSDIKTEDDNDCADDTDEGQTRTGARLFGWI